MPQFLNERDRSALARLRDCMTDPKLTQRAQILLLVDEAMSTADIAAAVEGTDGQVRYWRREWEKRGIDIFPPEAQALLSSDQDEPVSSLGASIEDASLSGNGASPDAVALPGVGEPRRALSLQDAPGVEPGDSMAEAGRKVLLFHFERMLLNEPGARLGDDIEGVHDMRVATRRMRSAIRLFEPFFKPGRLTPFNASLKKAGGVLGEVRDLDVFMEKAQRFAKKSPDVNLTPLFDEWQVRLDVARERLVHGLDSREFDRFTGAFDDFLTTPGKGARPQPDPEDREPYEVRHVLPRLLYGLYEQVRVYDDLVDSREVATLHALRIELKRLRYALEFFEEVLGPEGRAVIKEVKALQDHLGDMNDAEVAEQILRDFVENEDRKNSGMPRFMRQPDVSGVRQYMIAKQDEKRRLIDTFPAAWETFTREDVRRNLALAIAAL
ncbi:CHAD domain-containing protein [Aggregatilinea lenta]|uniref:CHAD domain-containing protein n=1 Tax=Aggregatilinea lenta TaxID=913108 RepID=UPI000E5B480F|nr:CHAD domain-containing protein [Aggregatilinea lenta]